MTTLPFRSACLLFITLLATLAGCESTCGWAAPHERLTFPRSPLYTSSRGRFYDVNHDGKADFALLYDETGRLNVLAYDDDGDGHFDRTYRLSDYANQEVPHLVLLIDSLPYRMVAPRYQAGEWHWFYPPQKVIPRFPSMSIIIFNDILHGPTMRGAIERHYDRRTDSINNQMVDQVLGYQHPWQLRTDFMVEKYWYTGMMYVNPKPWFEYELARTKRAVDESLNAVTVAYLVSGSCMASKYGAEGLTQVLDQIEQLCVQLLYERRGAIKISIVSDHGHTLTRSTNIQAVINDTLRQAGFNPTDRLRDPQRDVFLEIDGLVSSFAVNTGRPAQVANVLLARPEVELALYQEADRVILRSAQASAAIERRGLSFRYTPIRGDVLDYKPLLETLAAEGKVDRDGFVDDQTWLQATRDHQWPDVPRRAWDAFHGQVINPADVLFTLKEGYCAGLGTFDDWIVMASTHGGLNQINSDAVVMTMTGPLPTVLRSRDVMSVLEPRYTPYLPPRSPKQ